MVRVRVTLKAKSIAELEEAQERLKEEWRRTGRKFIARLELDVPANGPCPCGSGRKWKKCCRGDFDVTVRVPPTGDSKPGVEATAEILGLLGAMHADLLMPGGNPLS